VLLLVAGSAHLGFLASTFVIVFGLTLSIVDCIIRVIALKRQQANTTLAVLEGNLAGSDALLAGNDLIQGYCRCQ